MSKNNSEVFVKHYDYIDGLRGVAALLVLFVHMPQVINLFNGKGFSFGAYGVQLFYILSAFTLFLSSSQRFFQEDKAKLKFFIRRFFRIAPLFYIAVIVAWLLWGGVEYRLPAEGITINNVISHFLFLFGFNKYWINSIIGVEWSIFCEVLFYISLPLLFNYIKTKKNAIQLSLVSIFVAYIFKFSIQYFFPNDLLLQEWSSLFIVSNYFYFLFGVILYFIFKENKRFSYKKLIIGWLLFIVSVSSIIIIKPAHFGALLSSLPLALLVFLMKFDFPLAHIFNNKITRFIGKISYSMYLTHFLALGLFAKIIIKPNISFFNQNTGSRILGIFSAALFIVMVSKIVYELIEKPGIKIGKKLITKIS
jgi:peptidoglycan/LPS O-acetylase OafA/YrhL